MGLAPIWLLDKSPSSPQDLVLNGEPQPDELDYALVRLAKNVGELPIGTEDPAAPKRGWLSLPPDPSNAVGGDTLFVFQYPQDLRLQLAIGNLLHYSAGGTRMRHNARTLDGSSGSPCFDVDLTAIGLHHAGDPIYDPKHRPQYNQAIPLSQIVALMKQRGIEGFWDKAPS